MSEERVRRQWTEAQMRGAITALVSAAYGKAEIFPMHIPGQPTDADVLLHDAIDELLAWRAKQQAIETTKAVLVRLARYYDGRARASRKVVDPMEHNPSVRLHHELDAYGWTAKAEAVRKVAENLEIEIPAEQAKAPISGSKPLSGWHQHIYLDGLEIFPATGKPPETGGD